MVGTIRVPNHIVGDVCRISAGDVAKDVELLKESDVHDSSQRRDELLRPIRV